MLGNLDILKSKILTDYMPQGNSDPAIIRQERDLFNATRKKTLYDAKFLEEQYVYQASPIKRKQTLQDFVLLFFFVSFAIFSLSIVIYSFLINGMSYEAAAKTLSLCIILGLLITVVLMKFA